jgi:hypothetical protein
VILDPIVLFEGAEDKAFLQALLLAHGILGNFLFPRHDGFGKDGFQKILAGLVTVNHRAIIIVADNDGAPTTAFQNIQRQIRDAGYTSPTNPRETAQTTGLSPVSVLMIPWDDEAGCLETLCLGARNTNYEAQWDCANALVQCANAGGWEIAKREKLRMRAFLSSVCRSDPNTGLRFAWTTDGGRPGNIFPFTGIDAYSRIVEYFRSFAI